MDKQGVFDEKNFWAENKDREMPLEELGKARA